MRKLALTLTVTMMLAIPGFAQTEPPAQTAEKAEAKSVVTHHQIRIGGETVRYAATAGWLIMRGEKGEPIARFGYTAYIKDGVTDPTRRLPRRPEHEFGREVTNHVTQAEVRRLRVEIKLPWVVELERAAHDDALCLNERSRMKLDRALHAAAPAGASKYVDRGVGDFRR